MESSVPGVSGPSWPREKRRRRTIDATDVITRILEVLQKQCDNPADEIRRMGKALIGVADALEGISRANAIDILNAVALVERAQPRAAKIVKEENDAGSNTSQTP
jgi:predicted NBD/HSP70 family sugar kinase